MYLKHKSLQPKLCKQICKSNFTKLNSTSKVFDQNCMGRRQCSAHSAWPAKATFVVGSAGRFGAIKFVVARTSYIDSRRSSKQPNKATQVALRRRQRRRTRRRRSRSRLSSPCQQQGQAARVPKLRVQKYSQVSGRSGHVVYNQIKKCPERTQGLPEVTRLNRVESKKQI